MTKREVAQVHNHVRRLEREHRDRMRGAVRVERRLIHVGGVAHLVDVKVCPPTGALGDVAPVRSYAEMCREPLGGMK